MSVCYAIMHLTWKPYHPLHGGNEINYLYQYLYLYLTLPWALGPLPAADNMETGRKWPEEIYPLCGVVDGN